MDKNNHGILIAPPRPADYILGSTSPLKLDRSIKDWSIYLPTKEPQYNDEEDFLICVTMSALHSIECQLNYLLASDQLSDEALFFFHNNNYIVNGSFNLSDRFNAKLNGTEKQKGNYLNKVADGIRRDGVLPGLDWPMRKDMSWTEFYGDIPIGFFMKALKSLWFIDIKYQWVKTLDFLTSLPTSPLQVATAVCSGWDSGRPVQKCSSDPQHATLLYGQDDQGNWLDFDHYPPYNKRLAPNYEFPYTMQYLVTVKPTTLRKGMHGKNVLKLQKDFNMLGFLLHEDSDFGPKTEMMVKNFQNKTALIPDGIAGPKTLAKLKELIENPSISETITEVCIQEGVEPELAIAVAQCESGLNPRAVNKNSDKLQSSDRGLFQWNDLYHPEITEEMAFDPKIATQFFCKAVKAGNLHRFWSASEPRWKKLLPGNILKKYGIIS